MSIFKTPRHGSVDWAAQKILRLLDREEREEEEFRRLQKEGWRPPAATGPGPFSRDSVFDDGRDALADLVQADIDRQNALRAEAQRRVQQRRTSGEPRTGATPPPTPSPEPVNGRFGSVQPLGSEPSVRIRGGLLDGVGINGEPSRSAPHISSPPTQDPLSGAHTVSMPPYPSERVARFHHHMPLPNPLRDREIYSGPGFANVPDRLDPRRILLAQSGNPPSGSGIDGSASPSLEESIPPSTGFRATPEERKELIRHTIDVWEGGYVDDPDDPGGETNFGITTSAIDDYMRLTKDKRFKNKSPGQITRAEAELIYDTIMTGYQIDQIEDPNIRAQVFDMVVNMGPGGGMGILHNVLLAREEDVGKGIEIGPKTRGVLNGLFRAGQEAELAQINNALARAREAHYEQLIQEKPSLAKFRRGWLRRTRSFLLPEETP